VIFELSADAALQYGLFGVTVCPLAPVGWDGRDGTAEQWPP